jgi:hypothetical protein
MMATSAGRKRRPITQAANDEPTNLTGGNRDNRGYLTFKQVLTVAASLRRGVIGSRQGTATQRRDYNACRVGPKSHFRRNKKEITEIYSSLPSLPSVKFFG